MTWQRRLMLGGLFALLFSAGHTAVPANEGSKRAYRRTVLGFSGTNGGFHLSGGNLLMHDGKPGVLFGTVRTSGNHQQFSYIVVFKHVAGDDDSFSHSGNCQTSGKSGSTTCSLSHNDKQISVLYRVDADDPDGQIIETLRLDGQQVEIAAGRVFLIDLTTNSPPYKQLKIDQPVSIGSLKTTKDIERIGKRLMAKLKTEISGMNP